MEAVAAPLHTLAGAVRRQTLTALQIVDGLSDDPFTNAAIDLEQLPDKDDDEEAVAAEPDTISDLEARVAAEMDLAAGGGLPPIKATLSKYRAWTHRMKRFCPQPPETVTSKIDRVFWIDVMRIIACFVVPLVHAGNYSGTYGNPSPRYLGFYYCGYDQTDPSQIRPYNIDRVFDSFQEQLEAYQERRDMTGFMTFFFASGAAMFLSMRRIKRFWYTFFYRNIYLAVIVTLGSLLCVIPVNVIYYGAHGTAPWHVDPTQHLGFIFTLMGFTAAATPAAWGIIKQSFMGWVIQAVVIGLLTIFYIILAFKPDFPWQITVMWCMSMVNMGWMLVSSYIRRLRDFRFPITVILSAATWAVPTSMSDIWGLRGKGMGNILATLGLIVSYYLIPFILGFCVVGFPTNASLKRTYTKAHLALGCYVVFSPYFDPFTGDGWMEAWSIRTFDGRLQRVLYTMSCWMVVILIYNVGKALNECPYPRFLGLLNKYCLFLFIFHPLFLALVGCYIIVNTHSIPLMLETIILYIAALIGCFAVFMLLFLGLPIVVRKGKQKVKGRRGGKRGGGEGDQDGIVSTNMESADSFDQTTPTSYGASDGVSSVSLASMTKSRPVIA